MTQSVQEQKKIVKKNKRFGKNNIINETKIKKHLANPTS